MKKITIGDTSKLERDSDKVYTVRREDSMEVGEKVAVRFKGEFDVTDYRPYLCVDAEYRDPWDKQKHRRNFCLKRLAVVAVAAAVNAAILAPVFAQWGRAFSWMYRQ